MESRVIASFATDEPEGKRRWEYELLPTALRVRATGQWETSESALPLQFFTTDEVTHSILYPFVATTTSNLLLVGIGLPSLVCWIGGTLQNSFHHTWQHIVIGFMALGPLLLCTILIAIRAHSHDRGRWRWVEFRCPTNGEPNRTIAVQSREGAIPEQEDFLIALRQQIRRCHSAPNNDRRLTWEDRGKVLTTYAIDDVNGTHFEYELYSDAIKVRIHVPKATVETLHLFNSFSGEEAIHTFRKPFVIFTGVTGIFSCLAACAGILGLIFTFLAALDLRVESFLLGLVCFPLPFLAVATFVSIRRYLHDWREWTTIGFHSPRDGDPNNGVWILSDERNYAAQDQFVAALRDQLRR